MDFKSVKSDITKLANFDTAESNILTDKQVGYIVKRTNFTRTLKLS